MRVTVLKRSTGNLREVIMRKRRPQTYPAFLSEVHYVLKELHEGAEFKRKNNRFYACGYEAIIKVESISFFRYDKIFLSIVFNESSNSTVSTHNMEIMTDTWKIDIKDDNKYLDMELPFSKDEHFNLSTLHPDLPEWEDMNKINSIHELLGKLNIKKLITASKFFYP